MRIATSPVFAIATIASVCVSAMAGAMAVQKETQDTAGAPSSAQHVFEEFGLFGTWAIDCKKPADLDNPHVIITAPTPERVQEDHDLGPDYAINRYSVLSAERISPTRLSVEVLFQRGTSTAEEQRLIFLVANDTRRTLFNQPKAGAVRVKDGIVLTRGEKTPLLAKCH
jgi:hypothetical protein